MPPAIAGFLIWFLEGYLASLPLQHHVQILIDYMEPTYGTPMKPARLFRIPVALVNEPFNPELDRLLANDPEGRRLLAVIRRDVWLFRLFMLLGWLPAGILVRALGWM